MIILFMKSLMTRRSTRHPVGFKLQTPDSRPQIPRYFHLTGKAHQILATGLKPFSSLASIPRIIPMAFNERNRLAGRLAVWPFGHLAVCLFESRPKGQSGVAHGLSTLCIPRI
jgi:hypothetical protein